MVANPNKPEQNKQLWGKQSLTQVFLMAAVLFVVNVIAQFAHTKVDLTEERRYTLTPETVNMLHEMKDNVYIEVFLEGKFPAGFKRLQEAIKDKLDQFRNETPYIQYNFRDPLDVSSVEEKNERIKTLASQGIKPVNLKVFENDQQSEKLIYPVAVVKFGSHTIPVNLLENSIAGFSDEELLNQSINLLEYKLADAINKIFRVIKPGILLTAGHGESKPIETQDFINTMAPFYDIKRIHLDSIYKIPDQVGLVIMPNPQTPYSEKAKFVLDQFVMRGGRIIFLVNKVKIDLDSLRRQSADYVPLENNVNLDDLFFKYGFRIQPNLILDMECSTIPLAVGKMGTGAQLENFPWYYAPLMSSQSEHPIVKNIDRVNLSFPNSIDTIKTKVPLKKTILLASSKYSRVQFIPARINFEILRYPPDPAKFNKPFQPAAVLVEGSFPSLYENRVGAEMQQTLKDIKTEFISNGKPTKIMVVTFGKLLENKFNPNGEDYLPIGYNSFDKQMYGNKDFLLNSIEYMFDEKGILKARSKEVKLRLLDKVAIDKNKSSWQLLNVVFPLLAIGLFAGAFAWWKRWKYAR